MAMNPLSTIVAASIFAASSIASVARAEESDMNQNVETLELLYERFNAKDIDGVLAKLSDNVEWANGMDGGYVQGHDGIRAYWTRQWSVVDPTVQPVHFDQGADGSVVVEVKQTIRDLEGNPVQEKGLKDKTVIHIFSTSRVGKSLASTFLRRNKAATGLKVPAYRKGIASCLTGLVERHEQL